MTSYADILLCFSDQESHECLGKEVLLVSSPLQLACLVHLIHASMITTTANNCFVLFDRWLLASGPVGHSKSLAS